MSATAFAIGMALIAVCYFVMAVAAFILMFWFRRIYRQRRADADALAIEIRRQLRERSEP